MFDGQIPAGGIRLRAVLARQIKRCGEPLSSRRSRYRPAHATPSHPLRPPRDMPVIDSTASLRRVLGVPGKGGGGRP
jgi:hypothetical protein